MLSFSLHAQKNVEKQALFWNRYYLRLKLENNFQVRHELEQRTYWFPIRRHQFITRTAIQKTLPKNWSVGAGGAYFQQSLQHGPAAADYENQHELRAFLELTYQQSVSNTLKIHHRYWSEFRFFKAPGESGYSYGNNRFRYKLELRFQATEKLKIKTFDEIHLNIGSNILHNVFNQNRYGASVQYQMLPKFGIEFGYIDWFQQRVTGEDFYNRNIFRVTLHHTLDFTK